MYRIPLAPGYIIGIKTVIHVICAAWIVYMFNAAIHDTLDGDPVEALLHFTGIGSLHLLLLTLVMSPLAKWQRQGGWIKFRRMLGLWAFIYALSHFAIFVLFELQLEWQLLTAEIINRPYITVGFTALLILISMAATSLKRTQRKMGKRWQQLHNSVYIAAILIMLHFMWSLKTLELQILLYSLCLLALLILRRDKFKRMLVKK